jgi:hypothetical protein
MHDARVEAVWVFHQGLVPACQEKLFPGLRDQAELRGRGQRGNFLHRLDAQHVVDRRLMGVDVLVQEEPDSRNGR